MKLGLEFARPRLLRERAGAAAASLSEAQKQRAIAAMDVGRMRPVDRPPLGRET